MSAPTAYLHLPGTARQALEFYRDVFGGEVRLDTFSDFGRTDGPPDAVANGRLVGPVELFAADTAGDEVAFESQGLMFALLGTASASVLRSSFDRLADGGVIVDALQQRPWGAWDGQVTDRFGLTWLIGFEDD